MNIFNKFAHLSFLVLFSAMSFACDNPSPEDDPTAKKTFLGFKGKALPSQRNPSKRKLFHDGMEEDVREVFVPKSDKRQALGAPRPNVNIVPHFRSIDDFMTQAERMRQSLMEFNAQLELQVHKNKSVAVLHFPITSNNGENINQLIEAASSGFLSKENYSQEEIGMALRIQQTNIAAEYCKKAVPGQVKAFKAAYNGNKCEHLTDSLLRLNREFVFYRTLISKLFDMLSGYQHAGVLGVYFKELDAQRATFEVNSVRLAGVFEACWDIERDVCVHWPLLNLANYDLASSWHRMWGALHEKNGLRDMMKGLFKNYVSSAYTYLYASGVTSKDLEDFYSLLSAGREIDYRDKESLITMASVQNLEAFLWLRAQDLKHPITMNDLANNRALLTQIGSCLGQNRQSIENLSFLDGKPVSEGAEEVFKKAEQIFIQVQGFHKRLTEGTIFLSEEQEAKLKQLYRDGHKVDALAELLRISCLRMTPETKNATVINAQYRSALGLYVSYAKLAHAFIASDLAEKKVMAGFEEVQGLL
jgi:hypothetical protein